MGVWGVPQWGPRAESLVEGLGALPPEADDTFVKMRYFITVLRMT